MARKDRERYDREKDDYYRSRYPGKARPVTSKSDDLDKKNNEKTPFEFPTYSNKKSDFVSNRV